MNKVINHFGLSGGKDSTALWGWAINESGYPLDSIRGSFCDTENEYKEVYEQIKILDQYGRARGVAPVAVLRSEGFLNLCLRKRTFPSSRRRFCTEELKLKPSRDFIRYFTWIEGLEVVSHSGVRRSESDERAQLDEWDFDTYLGVKVRRPLLDLTIQQVWDSHKRYGLPINPLYFKGRKRVGCKLCCMSNKGDIRATVLLHPEVIQEYARWEVLVTAARTHLAADPINDWASFFHSDKVPNIMCSKTYRKKDGTIVKVASIADLARWSLTLRGGVQGGFKFMFDEDDDFDGGVACKSAMGHCE